MAFLKKSLFLVLFLGIVSLSICEEEKREGEEEEKQEEENEELSEEELRERRALLDKLKSLGKVVGKVALGVAQHYLNPQQ
uniref:Raniseptin-7 n=1 Tax=Boana raniceps TaxID=192750 RepID=RNSP7_BOARA|nr:RecName: Full=Raniseptin-7; Short=Rsp-7; Flags: Precursor [Boana raniceps]